MPNTATPSTYWPVNAWATSMCPKKDPLFVPGSAFGCPGYFQLCYCVSYDTIERSLPLLRELINEA